MQTRFVNHIAGASETVVVTLTIDPGTISLDGATTTLTLKKKDALCPDAVDYSKAGTIDVTAKTLTFFIQKGETSALDVGDYEYRIYVEAGSQKRYAARGLWRVNCGS